MSASAPRDPGTETLTAVRGSALPFLPTLLTAIAIGLVSLLCRAPSAPEAPAQTMVSAAAAAAPAGSDGFHPVLPVSDAAPNIPATLAFGQLHPLTLHPPRVADAAPAGKASSARGAAARSARTASRRTCGAQNCPEGRHVDTATRAVAPPVKAASDPESVPAPMRGRGEVDEVLPTGALPFAATAASWVERVRTIGGSVGNGAASLTGSVVDLLASAR